MLINSYLEKVQELNNETIYNYSEMISSLNQKEKIEILVAGELSNGKSTFLNTILKREILPTGIGVTTGKLTYIQKGNNNFILSDSVKYDLDLTQKDEELQNFIETIMEKNIEGKIYLFLKDFPSNDIIFVDTPGVNDINKERELLTYQYAPFSDVVIFIADISKGLSSLEKNFFDDIDSTMKDKIFLLFNKIDAVRGYNQNQPQNYLDELEIKNIKSYGISSYQAFEAVQNSDDELFKLSNIHNFMEDLFEYISTIDKTKVIENRKNKLLTRINDLAKLQLKNLIENYDKDIELLAIEVQKIDKELQEAQKLYEAKNRELKDTIESLHLTINKKIETLEDYVMNSLKGSTYIDEKIEFLQSNEFTNLCSNFTKDIKEDSASVLKNIDPKINKIELDFISSMIIKLDDNIIDTLIAILPVKHPMISMAKPFLKKGIDFLVRNKLEKEIDSYLLDTFEGLKENINSSFIKVDENISFELKKDFEEIKTQKLSLEQTLSNQNNKLKSQQISKSSFVSLEEDIAKYYKDIVNV